MTEEILIEAEHVSKKFCRSLKRSLWYGVRDILGGGMSNGLPGADTAGVVLPPLRRDEFWALSDISFRVRRGECLGLIGHNGAGKSTLLKILNGLLRPDTGRITMRGRVGALIELNAGFNPILTGRENVFHQAALLGFSAAETRASFDDIVDFSEIGEFIDMPVQNYSSGMKVRLGFAVAAQMQPDVLLIDEVLAVGDVGFRSKCLARIGDLLKTSACVFVSHSMPQVARIATEILHLHHGSTTALTRNISQGMDSYYSGFKSAEQSATGSGQVQIVEVTGTSGVATASRGEQLTVEWNADIRIAVTTTFFAGTDSATIQLLIWNQEVVPVVEVLGSAFRRVPISPDESGACRVSATIAGLQLNSGRYYVSVIVLSPDGMTSYAQVDQAIELRVSSNHGSGSSVLWAGDWAVETATR